MTDDCGTGQSVYRCHADPLYAGLHRCPACGHRSLDVVNGWAGCERRACGYEVLDPAPLARRDELTPRGQSVRSIRKEN
jgi:hypothetical protein